MGSYLEVLVPGHAGLCFPNFKQRLLFISTAAACLAGSQLRVAAWHDRPGASAHAGRHSRPQNRPSHGWRRAMILCALLLTLLMGACRSRVLPHKQKAGQAHNTPCWLFIYIVCHTFNIVQVGGRGKTFADSHSLLW